MSMVKRDLEEHENRLAELKAIVIEAKVYDGENEDPDADKKVYAIAFRGWVDGKLSGTPEEIFEAATDVVNDAYGD